MANKTLRLAQALGIMVLPNLVVAWFRTLCQRHKFDRVLALVISDAEPIKPLGALSANITETPAPLGITVGRWR